VSQDYVKRKISGTVILTVSGGTCGEEERERILMDLMRELVQHPFEVGHHIDVALLQGMPHGHQEAPRVGASIGRRADTDLAGDEGALLYAPSRSTMRQPGSGVVPNTALGTLAACVLRITSPYRTVKRLA
jgi:hypothetical protein